MRKHPSNVVCIHRLHRGLSCRSSARASLCPPRSSSRPRSQRHVQIPLSFGTRRTHRCSRGKHASFEPARSQAPCASVCAAVMPTVPFLQECERMSFVRGTLHVRFTSVAACARRTFSHERGATLHAVAMCLAPQVAGVMLLDPSTVANLELLCNLRTGDPKVWMREPSYSASTQLHSRRPRLTLRRRPFSAHSISA